jgi:hypothetical protein
MYDDEDLGLLERAAGAQAAAVAAATGAPDDAEMDEETALAMALAMSMGDTDAAPRYRPTFPVLFGGFVHHVHVVAPRALPAVGPCVWLCFQHRGGARPQWRGAPSRAWSRTCPDWYTCTRTCPRGCLQRRRASASPHAGRRWSRS